MATALRSFDLMQIGKETTKGTRVAATKKLVGQGYLTEEIDRYYSNYPRGVRGTVGGDGVAIRKGTRWTWETELNAEEILWPLHMGLKGGITASGTTAKTWTFSPELTGAPTLTSATIECIQSDGSTNHIVTEAGYALVDTLKLDWAMNQVGKMSWSGFARARQSDTPTGSLTPYSSREELVTPLLAVYADTSWAGLGGTALAGVVRSASAEFAFGNAPDYTFDQRSDLDFSQHKYGPVGLKLNLTMELNATGASEFANWRAGTRRFVRLSQVGSVAEAGTPDILKEVRVDASCRISAAPQFSDDGDFRLVSLQMDAVYDATASKIFEVTAVNLLASL